MKCVDGALIRAGNLFLAHPVLAYVTGSPAELAMTPTCSIIAYPRFGPSKETDLDEHLPEVTFETKF